MAKIRHASIYHRVHDHQLAKKRRQNYKRVPKPLFHRLKPTRLFHKLRKSRVDLYYVHENPNKFRTIAISFLGI